MVPGERLPSQVHHGRAVRGLGQGPDQGQRQEDLHRPPSEGSGLCHGKSNKPNMTTFLFDLAKMSNSMLLLC